LHADADEQKGGKAKDYVHSCLAKDGGEAVRETIANVDTCGHDRSTDHSGQDGKKISAEMVGCVGAERDGDGDGAGADGERQCERIKGAAENVSGVHIFLNLAALVGIFLHEQSPAVGDDDEAATNLDDGDGDAEEGEDVRANEVGRDDKDEAVERDTAGEEAASRSGVVLSEREEDRTAADRIDDGEEGANDEEDAFGDFEQSLLRVKV